MTSMAYLLTALLFLPLVALADPSQEKPSCPSDAEYGTLDETNFIALASTLSRAKQPAQKMLGKQLVQTLNNHFTREGFRQCTKKFPETISKERNLLGVYGSSFFKHVFVTSGQVRPSHVSPFIMDCYDGSNESKFVMTGPCWREENDTTHLPKFHQWQLVMISSIPSVCAMMSDHTEALMVNVTEKIFNVLGLSRTPIQLQKAYLPEAVDGGLEIVAKNIEIVTGGMQVPKVLKAIGADPEESCSFCYGMGIERLLMVINGANDIHDVSYE